MGMLEGRREGTWQRYLILIRGGSHPLTPSCLIQPVRQRAHDHASVWHTESSMQRGREGGGGPDHTGRGEGHLPKGVKESPSCAPDGSISR